MAAALEVELKLVGDPSELSAAFENLSGDPPIRQTLLSTYYDTPEGHLRRRGFALRVREESASRELTLKQDRGDGLTRGEWTSPMDGPSVDLDILPRHAPRDALGISDPAALEPKFLTEIERSKKETRTGDAWVEVCLDTGRIVAGDRQEPVEELEFELLNGPVTDMLSGVRSVLGERCLSIGTRSKAERGMDLSRGASPVAVRGTKVYLDASDTVDRALAKVARATSMQLMGNLAPIVEASDAEGVHQLRVSLRRLRSALLFFKDHLGSRAAELNVEGRRALKRLGPARDFDVFLLETLPPVIDANVEEFALLRLRKGAEDRRRPAYEDVHRLIADPRFNRFLLDLMCVAESGGLVVRQADEPLTATATRMLARRYRALMKSGRSFDGLAEPQRHRVRIALKKLRYACEYSRTLFPDPATGAYLRCLSELQDDLGRMNDAAVARWISLDVAGDDPDIAAGASLVGDWSGRWARSAEPRLRKTWLKFAETKPFWQASEQTGAQRTAVPPHSAPEQEQRQQ